VGRHLLVGPIRAGSRAIHQCPRKRRWLLACLAVARERSFTCAVVRLLTAPRAAFFLPKRRHSG